MDSRKRARIVLGSSSNDNTNNINGGGGDRISDLCNELLHHILSFLPTQEVVQTCVLSKRWMNLWRSVPSLDFDESSFRPSSTLTNVIRSILESTTPPPPPTPYFSTFVNNAMLNFRDGSSNIRKLRLSCFSKETSNHVFEYIVTAVGRLNVQVLDLKFLNHQGDHNVLPPCLFICTSLTTLVLNNVVLPDYYSSISLSSLNTLHLIYVKFRSNRFSAESLFSNSPVLETLLIHNCNSEDLHHFKISALQLKNLIIVQGHLLWPPPTTPSNINTPSPDFSKTLIFCPNIISLELRLHLHPRSRWYVLKNLNSSLVEANIHIQIQPYRGLRNYMLLQGFMDEILCELKNAKAITLSGSCLQVMRTELNIKQVIPNTSSVVLAQINRVRLMRILVAPFHNLKLLKLKTWFESGEVQAITDILKRSPNIETLVIECNNLGFPWREEVEEAVELPSECTLYHLKTIQMRVFRCVRGMNQVKLLNFLLENAKSLEKGGFHIKGSMMGIGLVDIRF